MKLPEVPEIRFSRFFFGFFVCHSSMKNLIEKNGNNLLRWLKLKPLNKMVNLTFQKSDQSFLRIELSDKDGVNQKILRPYNAPMQAKIVIRNDGYKKFQNITVHTQVGFQIASEFWQANVICILITGQSIYSSRRVLFIERIKRYQKKNIFWHEFSPIACFVTLCYLR